METDANGIITVSELGKPRRYVTDHNTEGKAIFSTAFDEDVSSTVLPGILIYDSWNAPHHPIQMNDGEDIKATKNPPQIKSLCPEGVTVARFVDFLPGRDPVNHRTISRDFGILLSGELELLLDSGEKRALKPGDVVVQRGTEHAWRNPHPSKVARAFFVQSSALPVVVQGQQLPEHTDWPEGAKPSVA